LTFEIPFDKEVPPLDKKQVRGDKTVYKSLSQCSFAQGGEVSAIDVKDGKILRIRPHHFDEKYTKERIGPWKIEKNGESYEAPLKGLIAPYQLAYKKRVYSPNRIMYPLKRIDWNPSGERNPQNRGKSKYQRISWNEAATFIADEIKRIKKQYGPMAVLCHGDGHGETKTVHGPHGCQMKLMDLVGGYTLAARNADSWEGWYWGTKHVWGDGENGLVLPSDNVLNDVTQHSDLLIHMGADLETTPWGFAGQFPSNILFFWTKIGKKQVFISPDLNYSAAVHADKWIPILPNTDAALQLAIAYVWITKGSYDKEYVKTHVVGFDKFSAYVLGEEDGEPKTPDWASGKCGVPEWTIKALATQWAKNITSVVHYYGGSMIRGPYSHEPARLEACLLGMQGLGKPGVHQYYKMGGDTRNMVDVPRPVSKGFLESQKMWPGALQYRSMPQTLPKTLVHHAILHPPVYSWGSTLLMEKVEDQFKKFPYPLPKEQGGTEVHMIWMDNPCRTTCWNNGYLSIEAFRSPKIETLVVQHPWLENDTIYADIILPVNTKIEEDDFMRSLIGVPQRGMLLEEHAIEPLGESKSDYEAVGEVAKKLGLYTEYTDGMTVPEKIRKCYDFSHLQDLISWEEFQEKKYFIIPTDPDWEKVPAGLRLFYEDPVKNPLPTPSGKLEFYSQRLADYFPDDKERGPLPKWIEKGPSHDERLSSKRAQKYPLLMISNHGRWRTHAQNDDITWTREIYTCKVKAGDGYLYEPVWINPRDAAARDISNGDIVKVINERGAVLGGAIVWERIMAGAVYQDHGARADLIVLNSGEAVDRGGANNLISPENGTSQNCWGMATSGFLVDVQKVSAAEMADWIKKYPEAFTRDYDSAAGLCFKAWLT
jgi:molybdopterin guanine dinucleotide-containing S/N-oxide reductase-like protein